MSRIDRILEIIDAAEARGDLALVREAEDQLARMGVERPMRTAEAAPAPERAVPVKKRARR